MLCYTTLVDGQFYGLQRPAFAVLATTFQFTTKSYWIANNNTGTLLVEENIEQRGFTDSISVFYFHLTFDPSLLADFVISLIFSPKTVMTVIGCWALGKSMRKKSQFFCTSTRTSVASGRIFLVAHQSYCSNHSGCNSITRAAMNSSQTTASSSRYG